jgi:ribosomal protein S10
MVKLHEFNFNLIEINSAKLYPISKHKLGSGYCSYFSHFSKIDIVTSRSRMSFETRKFSVDAQTKAQLCISFQSFNENKNLETVVNSIELSKYRSGYLKSIRLPKKRTLYTVLRSPHVDKKSREQFEMKIHKQTFFVETENQYIRSQLLRLLFQDSPGVQCQVVVHYKTRIKLSNS